MKKWFIKAVNLVDIVSRIFWGLVLLDAIAYRIWQVVVFLCQ